MKSIFSSNLRRFRIAKKYTQEQVAELLGVSAQSVSRWECNASLPDVTILPEIARLYCVTIDDLYRETVKAYDNYAQRLAGVHEVTGDPEDFLRADREFRKLQKNQSMSLEDLRLYGCMYQRMMQQCKRQTQRIYDEILKKGAAADETVYWKTRRQKVMFDIQIGRGDAVIREQLGLIESGNSDVDEWICLIAAYYFAGQYQNAYEWFKRAIGSFQDSALLLYFGGDICKKLKKYEDAFEYWDKALTLMPQELYYDVNYSRGFCYEEIGEYEKAYKIWCAVADRLEQSGYVAEVELARKLAGKAKEKSFY